jgi:hypothetical protein
MPPPAIPKKLGVFGWLLLVGFFCCVAVLVYSSVGGRWAVGVIATVGVVATIHARRYFERLKEERKEESICTFARSLPAREHDTWVVRAVFEELSSRVRVPIRPTDDLKKDLKIDPDDLDETAFEIARRAGRSMGDTKNNPMFDRVITVADIIVFFEHQPKRPKQPTQRTGACARR